MSNIKRVQACMSGLMYDLNTLQRSRCVINLAEELERLEAMINEVSSVLVVAREAQTLWLIMSQVFSHKHTHDILQSEVTRFAEVQARWRRMQARYFLVLKEI